jgi:type IV pilus assembly protein PilN
MYSLDINFLNDRPDHKPDAARRAGAGGGRRRAAVNDNKTPFYIGLAALALLPLAMLGAWLFLGTQKAALIEKQVELTGKLGNLEAEKKNLAVVQAQIKQSTDETQALATVFNGIKPWSAMSQDIRDRLPTNVQILSLKQVDAPVVAPTPTPTPTPSPGATPAPVATPAPTPPPISGVVEITGLANTFNDVNDFLLTLKQSNFLKGDQTVLVSSELADQGSLSSLDSLKQEKGGSTTTTRVELPKLPKLVKFVITASLTDVPASELLRELERKGAVGLVTRIQTLKEKGVIK